MSYDPFRHYAPRRRPERIPVQEVKREPLFSSRSLHNLAAVIFFAFGCLMIAASVNLYYSLDAARAVVPFVLAGVAFFGAAASWKDAS